VIILLVPIGGYSIGGYSIGGYSITSYYGYFIDGH
jgi:hypothetical protein